VELYFLGSIRQGLEQTCPQLPPSPRLPFLDRNIQPLPQLRDVTYLPPLCLYPRTSHGSHLSKSTGLFANAADGTIAACDVISDKVSQGKKHLGEHDLLAGDLCRPESFVYPVPGPMR
jgi:hypothetical protein